MDKKTKVLIAIDSYKGSISSLEAGYAARDGILDAIPDAIVEVKALADGGEGTYQTLLEALGGEVIAVEVKDPLGRYITAHYGLLSDGTAVIEMAQASGIALLTPDELNPLKTNTFGFGQMVMDAYQRGAREFIIGIGGSATTEMGIGMLEALGFKMHDKNELSVESTVGYIDLIEKIDDSNVEKGLLNIKIQLACDVTNPLNGKNGAVAIFGPQKGVRRDQIELLDQKLSAFAKVLSRYTETDYINLPGAGAAGGLGFTISSIFKNTIVKSGAELIIDKLGIDEAIKNADIVITGEGRIDNQTASGKGPGKIAALAKENGCKVVGFSGILNVPYEKCFQIMDDIVQIKPADMDLRDAMEKSNAAKNMRAAVANYFSQHNH